MVQKSTPAKRSRGRPPEFDRDAVVAAAMSAFWTNGVDRTTLAELETATGTVRTTLYNSFDGKVGLHRAAAAMYVERVELTLFRPLVEGEAGIADVIDFLDLLADQIESGDNPPGCFIVNDLTSPERDDTATDHYMASLEHGLRAALTRAVERGELDGSEISPLADALVAAIIGINVVNRRSGSLASIPLLAGVKAVVESSSRPAHDGRVDAV